jgi:hypothetical protein
MVSDEIKKEFKRLYGAVLILLCAGYGLWLDPILAIFVNQLVLILLCAGYGLW